MDSGSSEKTAGARWRGILFRFRPEPAIRSVPERMNVFGISGFPDRETVSSNILAYFLDPSNPHGLGDLLLRSLWDELKGRSTKKEYFPDGLDMSVCSVETEYPARGHEGSAGAKRIDILVKIDDEAAIIIENKVDASLYNPLSIYREQLMGEGFDHPLTVVLHRYAGMAIDDRAYAKEYSEFALNADLFDLSYDDYFGKVLLGLGPASLNADLRSVDVLHQFIDNYSPRRIEQRMDESNLSMASFINQIDGVEDEMSAAVKAYNGFQKESLARLNALCDQIAEDEDVDIPAGHFTLFQKFYFSKRQFPCYRRFLYQNPLFRDEPATIEFFMVSPDESVHASDHWADINGNAGTIWYKAYWGPTTGGQEHRTIANPLWQPLGKSIDSSYNDILDSMREKRNEVLTAALDMRQHQA